MSLPPLWPHQEHAIKCILENDGFLVGHDMGTGKTRSCIEAMTLLGVSRCLIMVPKAVIGVWPQELKEYNSHLVPVPLDGDNKLKKNKQAREGWIKYVNAGIPAAFIINYESAWRSPIDEALLRAPWDIVVCDESHRIKSAGSKVSKFVAKFADKVPKRVALSGTPMSQGAIDIFGQARFLAPHVFGTNSYLFSNRYQNKIKIKPRDAKKRSFDKVIGDKNMDEFHAKLSTFAHFVKKSEVLHWLPEFSHKPIYIQPEGKWWKAYKEMRDELSAVVDESGKVIDTTNALTLVVTLQQMTSGFLIEKNDARENVGTVSLHDQKVKTLISLIEDMPPEDNVVVFARFRADLDAIRRASEKIGRTSYVLGGGKNEIGSKWEPEYPGSVAVVQVNAGGLGIDLTAAHRCVYYSQTHSWGDYDQSLARCHRSGQKNAVEYYHLIVKGTVDEAVYRALATKKTTIQSIIDNTRKVHSE